MGRILRSIFCLIISFFIILGTTMPTFARTGLSNSETANFKENKIIWWNPYEKSGGCPPGYKPASDSSNVIIQGDDNGSTTLGYLIQNGYSATAAAAIAGNLYVESGINPKKLEGGAIVDDDFVAYRNGAKTYSGGFGIAQWTSEGRVKNLQDYANSKNLSVTTLSAQLGFLLQELTGAYASTVSPSKLNSLSLEEAVFQVRRYYEGPAAMIFTTNNGKYYNDYVPNSLSELDEAKTPGAYREFNKALTAAQSLSGISPTYSTETGSNVICIPDDSITEDFVFYSQCDPQWGSLRYGSEGINGSTGSTICKSGCGPTSFAVIATNLLKKSITPKETSDVAGLANMYVPGAGSSNNITTVLAKHYGMSAIRISNSVAEINSYLEKGYMIHTSGTGSAPFTTNGHYIAIVAKLSNGNWLIGDSSKRGPSGEYKPEDVLTAGIKSSNIWAVK